MASLDPPTHQSSTDHLSFAFSRVKLNWSLCFVPGLQIQVGFLCVLTSCLWKLTVTTVSTHGGGNGVWVKCSECWRCLCVYIGKASLEACGQISWWSPQCKNCIPIMSFKSLIWHSPSIFSHSSHAVHGLML